MSKLIVNGGKTLKGEIDVIGAKNSVLPLLAATVVCKGKNILHNCPNLSDVWAAINILTELGCECEFNNGTLIVDSTNANNHSVSEELMREMRSSIVFLGALISRFGCAVMSSPGGCELGPRPIDLHITSLTKLGAIFEEKHGNISCFVKNPLLGCELLLSFPSVGATENIILAAVSAVGTTVIHNAACEPEICDLCDFLRLAGAIISGDGTSCITIVGGFKLKSAEHSVLSDRIVASTYLCAAAATRGCVKVNNISPKFLLPVIDALKTAGCNFETSKNSIYINAEKALDTVKTIKTSPYPGFPTDAGSVLLAATTTFNGISIFIENIFENRFGCVPELCRLGADIEVVGNVAVVRGKRKLYGSTVQCTDLRGGAALMIAALASEGTSVIDKIYHIDRGYEKIEESFSLIGADIKRL